MDPKAMLDRCETLMLDMDGTVLDLAFDNYVWHRLVPERYAHASGISVEAARDQLFAQYQALRGNLEWYCLDHWSDRLGMDMLELHRDVNHRIGYLPGAKEFLQTMRDHDIRVILVTNSHPDTLALKDEVTGLVEYFDGVYTSHGFGYAKESQEFWRALQDEVGFDAQTALMVDDTVSVLENADIYGVKMLVTVTRPDTTEPVRSGSDFEGVEAVADML